MKHLISALIILSLVFLSSCSDEAKSDLDDQEPVVLTSTSTALPTLQPTTTPTDPPKPKPTKTAAPERSEIAELLPEGTLTVDIMELGAPSRLEILLAKLQASIQQDQEWWTEYVNNAPPNQPLPYHEKMGLTEAEYAEMLTLMDHLVLRKARESVLIVSSDQDSHLILNGGTDLAELTGIEIDLDQDLVETPYGVATQRTTIDADDSQSTTGPWNGISWSLDTLDTGQETGTKVQFALGRLQESERGILYYQVKKLESGRELTDLWIVLNYDLP